MPGRARASRGAVEGEDSAEAGDAKYLARALFRYFGDRALPDAAGHRDPEILPQRVEAGAARALSRPTRGALQELEILDGRRRRTQAVAALLGRLSGHDPAHRDKGGAMVR